MLRFIWQNWWRHKERFILLLVGALIVSSGLSYLVGLSQTNKGTIVNALEKRWSASYDIVVRPPGSRSVTEDKHLLEPDYLSGLSGGISLNQYHKIQHIEGIKVAAPISMIGYIRYFVPFAKLNPKKDGIYRVHEQWAVDIGPRTNVDGGSFYFVKGPWAPKGAGKAYGISAFHDQPLTAGTQVLIAGIDPKAEAKLVGLDDAIVNVGKSRYFNKEDKSQITHVQGLNGKVQQTDIPVLISNRNFVNETYNYSFERLDLPFQNEKAANRTMEKVKKRGGKKYLNTVNGQGVQTYTFTSQQAHKRLMEKITGISPKTGKKASLPFNQENSGFDQFQWITYKPSPLHLRPVSSPFSKHWPFAYETKIFRDKTPVFPTVPEKTYRPVSVFGKNSDGWPRVVVHWVGIYDPGKLDISQDPLTELPMETYRPASAKLVLNADSKPVNPPIDIKPADKAYSFLTKPPMMLTTIQAAAKILGDEPISAIRIKVAGVSTLNQEGQQKLETIAKEIEKQTGLIADITLGSSPQPALTHIPAKGGVPEIGWIQQPWVKLGSSFAIFSETKVGFSGVIGSVILVAVVYVFASLLVSLLARRKEFAVLIAIGWRPRQLSKMIFLEAGLLGSFVALVSWTILGLALSIHQTNTTMIRFLVTGLFGFVIYMLGALIPSILARRIRPREALQSGEITRTSRRLFKTRTSFSMALNHLLGKWRRTLLSVIAIAVPTSLLAFFLFVTFRLKGVMYTTWLGQYVALEVGPQHYVAMTVALLIAVLTTAEIMWQNISERQPEIALLKAVGWRNNSVRILVLLEGGFSGLAAAVIGLAVAFGIIFGMYRQIPVNHFGFLISTGIIPIVTGLFGAFLPAERAVRILPSQGVRGQYENRKKTEKHFRSGLGIAAAILIAGFLSMIFTTVPKTDGQHPTETHPNQKTIPTQGKVGTKVVNSDTDETQTTDPNKEGVNGLDGIPAAHYHIELGETVKIGTADVGYNVFSANRLVGLPRKSDLGNPDEGMKYISIQVTFKNTRKYGRVLYQPYYFSLYTKEGEQKVVNVTNVKKNGYDGRYVSAGGNVESVLTFEVKKDVKDMVMIALVREFIGGKIAVKIK